MAAPPFMLPLALLLSDLDRLRAAAKAAMPPGGVAVKSSAAPLGTGAIGGLGAGPP